MFWERSLLAGKWLSMTQIKNLNETYLQEHTEKKVLSI